MNESEKNRHTEFSIEQAETNAERIVDSAMSREEALENVNPECPEAIKERQQLVDVKYFGPDGLEHAGQIMVDKALVSDVTELFSFLCKIKFPIEKVVPVTKYDWNDDASMNDNNSSGFNFRLIKGTDRISLHGFGFAIDLNPRQNPMQKDGETLAPKGAIRDLDNPNTLTAKHEVVSWLKDKGWTWGGDWQTPYQDYHHFEKTVATPEYIDQLINKISVNPDIDPTDLSKRIEKVIASSNSGQQYTEIKRLLGSEAINAKLDSEQVANLQTLLNKISSDEKI